MLRHGPNHTINDLLCGVASEFPGRTRRHASRHAPPKSISCYTKPPQRPRSQQQFVLFEEREKRENAACWTIASMFIPPSISTRVVSKSCRRGWAALRRERTAGLSHGGKSGGVDPVLISPALRRCEATNGVKENTSVSPPLSFFFVLHSLPRNSSAKVRTAGLCHRPDCIHPWERRTRSGSRACVFKNPWYVLLRVVVWTEIMEEE
jgi:hypothetical protein